MNFANISLSLCVSVCFNREALGEACNVDNIFAEALEAFAGGQDDLISVSVGGKFYMYYSLRYVFYVLIWNERKPS